MIILIRTHSGNEDFKQLVSELDKELSHRDGDAHTFYNQFNQLEKIKHAVIAIQNDIPVGCGALRAYTATSIEIKRMYVPIKFRNQGIASQILNELEKWAKELGNESCILETGINQPEAIQLYTKKNYNRISNYAPYTKTELSVCFEKLL